TAQDGSLPTGSVLFVANGVGIAIGRLNNSGVAVVNYSTLAAGNNTLMALYQGSPTLAESLSQPVTQVVGGPLVSTTAVTSAPNPSTFGQQVMITATVGPAGPPAPTGTVGFTENGEQISGCTAVPVSSQIATCITSALLTGTNAIVAAYSGDINYTDSSGMQSQIVNPVPSAVLFVPVPPCRVVDTRNPYGNFGGPAIQGNSSRAFPLSESDNPCGIPVSAVAYSLNVTVVPMGPLSYLTIWPTGEGPPVVSTLNSPDGRVKANAAIVPAGVLSGLVSVFVTNTTNVILDIDGYFAPPGSGAYQFYPLTPCRIVDTRGGQNGGSLQAGVERDYSIPGHCGVSSNAAAYSFNVTVLPAAGGLDYLTVWPKGESRPTVSTLNDNTGTVVANAAIVAAGSENATAFYAHSNATNLLLDVDGYFATPGSGGLSLYPLTPCRVLDTRQSGGSFSGEKTVNVVGSACAPPSNAAAYIFNATVVPPGSMPYLTLWPDGEQQPVVSTLNAYDGFITSNMAIVPTNNGSIDAYAYALTQLILDISGYFAP
ncbi:MAG: Ig-like domain-containing protein, partial [Candidatus Korobacteraceae bacterium]